MEKEQIKKELGAVTYIDLKESLENCMKDISLDYEDFIGTTYTDDEKVWMRNFDFTIKDTVLFSKLKYEQTKKEEHLERLMNVMAWKKLIEAMYESYLEEK